MEVEAEGVEYPRSSLPHLLTIPTEGPLALSQNGGRGLDRKSMLPAERGNPDVIGWNGATGLP
jgi:hypothetical protein